MKGILIQINNIDNESIGLWYTTAPEIIDFPGMLVDWFRDFDDSDMYDEEGVDGFARYVEENHNYKIERVFIEEFLL